jgi:LemA protein
MEALYIGMGAIAVLAITVILIYNALVAKSQLVREAFSGIDVQLKLRRELIPNLVETVKGYAAHERETLNAVIDARNAANLASGAQQAGAAESVLSAALGRLVALAEAYPDLKASASFTQLQNELATIEDKVAAARRFHNSAVGDYNTAIQQFPGSVVAGFASFRPAEYFDVGEVERAAMASAPQVKF